MKTRDELITLIDTAWQQGTEGFRSSCAAVLDVLAPELLYIPETKELNDAGWVENIFTNRLASIANKKTPEERVTITTGGNPCDSSLVYLDGRLQIYLRNRDAMRYRRGLIEELKEQEAQP